MADDQDGARQDGARVSDAGADPRPVLYLSCAPTPAPTLAPTPAQTVAASSGLCAEVYAGLVETAPGYRVVQVPAPLQEHALGVHLEIPVADAYGLSARLSWRENAGADRWQHGPELALDVQDAPLNATMLGRFAQDLLRLTPLPFGA